MNKQRIIRCISSLLVFNFFLYGLGSPPLFSQTSSSDRVIEIKSHSSIELTEDRILASPQNIHPKIDYDDIKPLPLPNWKRATSEASIQDLAKIVGFDVRNGTQKEKEPEFAPEKLDANFSSPRNAIELIREISEEIKGVENFTNLTMVANETNYPYCTIVKLYVNFPSGTYVGSGVVIDSRTVLVTGHIVYEHEGSGAWANWIQVIPAYKNRNGPFGDAWATNLYTFTGWTNYQNYGYDIGWIQLDRPIGAIVGWLGYSYNDNNSFFTSNTFYNPGYPANSPYTGEYMYSRYGNFDNVTTEIVYTNNSSYGGQSGSPTYISGNTVYAVLSHTSGGTQTGYVRITPSKHTTISNAISNDTNPFFDLVPLAVSVTPYAINAGGQLTSLSYLIHNNSSAAWSGTVDVDVYLSTDNVISTGDELIQSRQFSGSITAKNSVLVSAASPLPTIPYNKNGNYYIGILLDIADYDPSNNSTLGWDSAPIVVNPTLQTSADFSGNPTSGCAPLIVTFTDLSQNATTWSWSFDGGNPSTATGQGPHQVVYNSPGDYDVSLSVSGAGGTDVETKNNYIHVDQCQSLEILYPNGGENIGCQCNITWTSTNITGNVKLEYYCNGIWSSIISNTPNDGLYEWTVPPNTSCSSKIKITSLQSTGIWDMSNNYFTINCIPSCILTVTAPNGGENIACSTTITWTSAGTSGNVKIEYYFNNSWTNIVNSTPDDGSYVWNVPPNTIGSSNIKITDLIDAGCFDTSDDSFNINCPAPACQITVTSPNGGETVGCNHLISWTSSNTSGNVKIEYECDGIWQVIVNSTADDGIYDWTIPSATNCSSASVKISDVANSLCSDESDNYFLIQCGVGPCNPPYVKANDIEGAAGQDIEVPVKIKDNTTPIDAFGFEFQYCADKLHLLEVVKGTLSSAFSFFQYQETSPGKITIGGFHTTTIPANSDGSIAILKLHIDACVEGETCTLTILNLVDDLAGMNACNGTFTCGIPCNLGDVNNDGSLTPGDALCAFQIYLYGGTPPAGTACDNECALYAADVNCTPDGITPGDALYIFQGYLSGKSLPLDCKPAAIPKTSNMTLNITTVEGNPDEEVVFTIELNQAKSIQAFGLDLGYPANLLTYVGIRSSGITRGWEVLDGRVNIDGVVTLGGFKTTAQENPNSVELVDVVFKVNQNVEGFGDLWSFNLTDDLYYAKSRPARFNTSIEGIRRLGGHEVPTAYFLEQNYPNPFNMDTEIIYQLAQDGLVTVMIYNSVGRQIRLLVNQHQTAGKYAARWDGKDDLGNDIPSGVYIYRINSKYFSDAKKMILIK